MTPPRYGGGFRGEFWAGFGGSGGIGGSSPPRLERGYIHPYLGYRVITVARLLEAENLVAAVHLVLWTTSIYII